MAQSETRRKRKLKEIFPFGNYPGYYGYRHQSSDENDDTQKRIALLDRSWFYGKKWLDVGCNTGTLTLEISKQFNCRYALGIDMDEQLIQKAERNRKSIIHEETKAHPKIHIGKEETRNNENTKDSKFDEQEQLTKIEEENSSLSIQEIYFRRFPNNIFFRLENFIEGLHTDHSYDVITCFNVTKWIHLNYGDEGVLTCFRKAFELLKPRGRFIVEYQPWKSYKKNKHITPKTREMFQQINIKPEDFRQVLETQVGFKIVDEIIAANLADGFQRPILVCRKP